MYDHHRCPESYKRDNQVPVCPLCNVPIPLRPGQVADVEVGRHIDSDCQSDPAKERRNVYTNRCSKKGCKVKELVPFNCGACRQNFCIKHRHEKDHSCAGFEGSGRGVTAAGAAAVSRVAPASRASSSSKQPPQMRQQTLSNMGLGRQLHEQRQARGVAPGGSRVTASAVHSMQGSMTEDQALAQALAMSATAAAHTQPASTQPQSDEEVARRAQEEEDAALAQALQQSEADARNARGAAAQGTSRGRQQQTTGGDKSSCLVS